MANFVWINGKRGNSEIYAWKIEMFGEICHEKSKFMVNCLERSKFFENWPEKIDFFTRIYDPQISNQIDAADYINRIE